MNLITQFPLCTKFIEDNSNCSMWKLKFISKKTIVIYMFIIVNYFYKTTFLLTRHFHQKVFSDFLVSLLVTHIQNVLVTNYSII